MATVLIVDDEPAILEVVAEFARMLGHDVLTAIDGEDALKLLRARRPDVVVSDVMMPRLSGPGLRAAMSADPTLAHVPIVFMTAVHRAIGDDATKVIKKPFDLDDLEGALREALSNAPPLPIAAPKTVDELARQIDGPLERARALVAKVRAEVGARGSLDELEQVLGELKGRVNAGRGAQDAEGS
jgi:CheY-like chemotaxis protein